MSPLAIVHIGTHKTGSTSLQHWLQLSSNSQSAEFHFDDSFYRDRHLLTEAADGNTESANLFRSKVLEAVAVASGKPVVISCESYCGTAYSGYCDSEKYANVIEAAFAGIDTELALYVRRQDSFIESMYAQSIHEGKWWEFSDFVASIGGQHLDWMRIVSPFAGAFGSKLRVFRYEDTVETGGIVPHFSGVFKLGSGSAEATSIRRNRSYGPDALELAKTLNPILDDSQRKKLRHMLQSCDLLVELPHQAKRYFTNTQRSEILARLADANLALAPYLETTNDTDTWLTTQTEDSDITPKPTCERALALMMFEFIDKNQTIVESYRDKPRAGVFQKFIRRVARKLNV